MLIRGPVVPGGVSRNGSRRMGAAGAYAELSDGAVVERDTLTMYLVVFERTTHLSGAVGCVGGGRRVGRILPPWRNRVVKTGIVALFWLYLFVARVGGGARRDSPRKCLWRRTRRPLRVSHGGRLGRGGGG